MILSCHTAIMLISYSLMHQEHDSSDDPVVREGAGSVWGHRGGSPSTSSAASSWGVSLQTTTPSSYKCVRLQIIQQAIKSCHFTDVHYCISDKFFHGIINAHFNSQEKCYTLFESFVQNIWDFGESSPRIPPSWTSCHL